MPSLCLIAWIVWSAQYNEIDGLVSESNVIPVSFAISTAFEGCSLLDLIKFYAPARIFLLVCIHSYLLSV